MINLHEKPKTPFLFKLCAAYIAFVFLAVLVSWSVFGVLAFKAVNAVSNTDFSQGIKPAIESIWCGQPGCSNEGKP